MRSELDFSCQSNVRLGSFRWEGCGGSEVGPAISRLVVGPDARLPRTSPVTLDVLTG